jgi:hypothetical protein
MPRGWRIQLWNSVFVGLAMIPMDKWDAAIGATWVPIFMGVCAIGNQFTSWVKAQPAS